MNIEDQPPEEGSDPEQEKEVDSEPLQAYVDGLSKDELYALKEIVDAACDDGENDKKVTMADIMKGGGE